MASDVVEFEDEEEAGFSQNKFTVFTAIVDLGNDKIRHVNLYFPNTPHTNYSGSKSPITQAGLASMYLMSGKWSSWFSSKLDIAYSDWKARLANILTKRMSAEVQTAIKSRYRALRRKESQSAMSDIKREISLAKSTYEQSRSARDYLREKIKGDVPDAIIPVDLWGVCRDEWIQDYKKSLKSELDRLTSNTRKLRTKYLTKKGDLVVLKNTLARKFESVQHIKDRERFRAKLERFDDEQDALISAIYDGNVQQFTKARKEAREQLEAIDNPYMYGMTVFNSIQKAAREAREQLVDWILGAKAPDIADRTKRNRISRGHDDEPPLNETGEFANSLKYEVI